MVTPQPNPAPGPFRYLLADKATDFAKRQVWVFQSRLLAVLGGKYNVPTGSTLSTHAWLLETKSTQIGNYIKRTQHSTRLLLSAKGGFIENVYVLRSAAKVMGGIKI